MREFLHTIFSRGAISSSGDELVIKYDVTSIVFWSAVPVLTLVLGLLCWVIATRIAARRPEDRWVIVRLRVAAGCLLLISVLIGALVVPSVIGMEVRISKDRLSQAAGPWFDVRVREIPLLKVHAVVQVMEPADSGAKPVWTVFLKDGTREKFTPGDLITANRKVIADQLRQYGIRTNMASSGE
jgi:hypothetical protein